MLDHILLDVIELTRRGMEDSLLQRQPVEERFQVDVLLGDVAFETSYALPGEDRPPRVRADLSFDWPTWSQSAYRSWSIGEGLGPSQDRPELVVEIALRQQRLAERPDVGAVIAVLPASSPPLHPDPLVRGSTVVEERHHGGGEPVRFAVETTYQGSIRFEDSVLDEPDDLAPAVGELGRWLASLLVRLADLPFAYLPPDPGDDGG